MKVVAFQEKDTVLVRMNMAELRNVTGLDSYEDFKNKYACSELQWGNADSDAAKNQLAKREFSVCDTFREARETLSAYDSIRKDLQSAITRMTKLTEKMVDIAPKKEDKKQ